MAHVLHLHSTGGGMAAKTACGRNVMRTPMSASWGDFKAADHTCDKCATSKLFDFLTRQDLAKWIPEEADAWKTQDDTLIAARAA